MTEVEELIDEPVEERPGFFDWWGNLSRVRQVAVLMSATLPTVLVIAFSLSSVRPPEGDPVGACRRFTRDATRDHIDFGQLGDVEHEDDDHWEVDVEGTVAGDLGTRQWHCSLTHAFNGSWTLSELTVG